MNSIYSSTSFFPHIFKICAGLPNSGVTEPTLTFSMKRDQQGFHQYLPSWLVTLSLHVTTYNQNLKLFMVNVNKQRKKKMEIKLETTSLILYLVNKSKFALCFYLTTHFFTIFFAPDINSVGSEIL